MASDLFHCPICDAVGKRCGADKTKEDCFASSQECPRCGCEGTENIGQWTPDEGEIMKCYLCDYEWEANQ